MGSRSRNNNNNNHNNNNNNYNNNKQKYVFGDVVFVVRRIGFVDKAIYHHAGIVTEVIDGEISQILHFDPLFDRGSNGGLPSWDLVRQSVVGVYSLPEFLEGPQLLSIFPPSDVHIEECGPEDELEQALVHSRIDEVRTEIMNNQKRLYQLHAYNCQHFATQIRTGVAHSPDAHTVVDSLRAGWTAWSDGAKERERERERMGVIQGEGERGWTAAVGGTLSLLWDSGVAATQHYFSQVQNRKADAFSRQCSR